MTADSHVAFVLMSRFLGSKVAPAWRSLATTIVFVRLDS
jgi:hypothetical protein